MKARLLLLAAILVLACVPLAGDCQEEGPVSTIGASDMHGGMATLNGRLNTMAGALTVQVWFSVTGPDGSEVSTPRQTLRDPGDFSFRITGLTANVPYKLRACAEGHNWNQERQGSSVTFAVPN